MYRAPNVISISSDEEEDEEEESNLPADPPKVDEVSLIAIDRKRKKPDDELEDDLVVVEVPYKEPLVEVTTHYENNLYQSNEDPLNSPTVDKPLKPVGPLIDLMSEEEDDDEIVFRPVTISPKLKRMKPTTLANSSVSKKVPNVTDGVPIERICTDTINEDSSKHNKEESLILQNLLASSEKVPVKIVSIMNNHLNGTDTKIKDDVIIIAASNDKNLTNNNHLEEDNEEDEVDNNDDDDDEEHDNSTSSSSSNVDTNHKSPSSSKSLDKSPESNVQRFKNFLRLCSSKMTYTKSKQFFREKYSKLYKSYKFAGDFVNSNDFQSTLCEAANIVKNTANSSEVVREIMKMYNMLKENRLEPKRNLEDDEKLDHLYELLKQCMDRIKTLETVEVNYDDEDNSAYCQLQTYRAKAAKVHERICLREKKSKYLDRMTYAKLDFDRSSYQAINIAINKKYKNNSVFPTFTDLNRLIRKCVTNNNIEISEMSLKEEIKTCFVFLGELLQRRRRHELLDSLSDFIDPKLNDPATKDAELDRKLRENKRIADQKTDEIVEKYYKIQQSGVEPDLSSDPDDSNVEINSSSGEEEK